MTGFQASWLALREPADRRARNVTVAAALSAALAGRSGLRILDLGAGSGNNMALTAGLLPMPQHWLLADNDPVLLARAAAPEGATCEGVICDLSANIDALLDAAPDLVTASAFFDLVGAAWIDRFVTRLAERRLPLFAVLSYDGEEQWWPANRLDMAALAAFHADQRRDKGLGASLGPQAHAHLARRLEEAGYTVTEGRSDWLLEQPRDGRLIAALADGSRQAIRPTMGAEADNWAEARLIAERARIGHRDLFALPA
jgi:hypothetical protein